MNELAAQQAYFVLYPPQSQDAIALLELVQTQSSQRNRGEPALIASEALSAMNGALAIAKSPRRSPHNRASLGIATIVFHGNQDKTVHPVNGVQVIEARLHHEAPGPGRQTLYKANKVAASRARPIAM